MQFTIFFYRFDPPENIIIKSIFKQDNDMEGSRTKWFINGTSKLRKEVHLHEFFNSSSKAKNQLHFVFSNQYNVCYNNVYRIIYFR